MSLHIFPHAPYINSAFKNQLFKDLATKLESMWSEEKFLALLGNIVVQGKMLDAVLISPSSICIIAFLDHGGRIEPRKTGHWRANGKPILHSNPYELLDSNAKLFAQSLHKIYPVTEVQGLVLFNKSIIYNEHASHIADKWFHVSDIQSITAESKFITSGTNDHNEESIINLLAHFGIENDLLDEVRDTLNVVNEAQLFFDYGMRFKGHGYYEDAIESLTHYIELKPDDAVGYYERGECRKALLKVELKFSDDSQDFDEEQQLLFDDIIDDYSKAIELNDEYAAAYYGRFDSHLITWDFYDAFDLVVISDDLIKAYKLDSENISHWETLKLFYVFLFSRVLADHDNALSSHWLENYLLKSEHCNDSAQLYLTNSYYLTTTYKYEAALKDLDKAIDLHIKDPYYHFLHDDLYLYKKIVFDWNSTCYPLGKGFIRQVYYNRAILNEYFSNYDQAIADYSTAANLPLNENNLWIELKLENLSGYTAPETAEALYQMGRCREAYNNFEAALEYFEAAIEKDECYLENLDNYCSSSHYYSEFLSNQYSLRALTKSEDNDFVGVIKDCNRAIELNVSNVDAYLLKAKSYVAIQQYKEAISVFTKALALDPTFLEDVLIPRGDAYVANKQYYEAIADYSEALAVLADEYIEEIWEKLPKRHIILERRAQCYGLLGHQRSAQQDHKEALKLKQLAKINN